MKNEFLPAVLHGKIGLHSSASASSLIYVSINTGKPRKKDHQMVATTTGDNRMVILPQACGSLPQEL
jgi:hypothetical protein